MQNLSYPVKKALINILTVKDLGYFTVTDPEASATVKKLIFKKLGWEIPYIDTTNTLVRNGKSKTGAYKSVLLQILAPAPCHNCRYEYILNVHAKFQQPGKNNDYFYPNVKSFGGKIEAIQTPSGGYMADSDILIMEDSLLTDIEADQSANTREPNIIHAKKMYLVTVPLFSTNILSYTIAGVTSTVSMTSGATAITMINDLNADATFAASFVAFAKDATHIYITSILPGVHFTLTDGAGVTTLTGITHYLWIYAKSAYVKFELEFPHGWATQEKFGLVVINNTAQAAGNLVFGVNGTTYTAASSTTSTTFAGNINAAGTPDFNTLYGWASAFATTGSVGIYLYTGAYEVSLKTLGTAGITITNHFSGGGKYPSLDWNEMFSQAMNLDDMGTMAMLVVRDQVIKDALYNKIIISNTIPARSLEGASHKDSYEDRYEIILQQGYATASLWDASNYMWESTADDATFSADSGLDDLLDAWSGTTLSLGLV